jgi:hypothetical protein
MNSERERAVNIRAEDMDRGYHHGREAVMKPPIEEERSLRSAVDCTADST